MFRGETFAATAVRKIRDETGNPSLEVEAKGIVNVWNTFFPDSSWDESRAPGREGTQTVNICVFCQQKTSDNKVWCCRRCISRRSLFIPTSGGRGGGGGPRGEWQGQSLGGGVASMGQSRRSAGCVASFRQVRDVECGAMPCTRLLVMTPRAERQMRL